MGWCAVTIRGRPSHGDGVLRNRLYFGQVVWNRRQRTVDPMSGQNLRRANQADEWVSGSAPEQRIIDDALWERVQQRLMANAAPKVAADGPGRFWEKKQPKHLLSGKLVCGSCKGSFIARAGARYECSSVKRGQCDNRTTHGEMCSRPVCSTFSRRR